MILNRLWGGGPNFCHDCGKPIPRRAYAFYGNAYRPYVCLACAAALRAKLDGQTAAFRRV